jgi:hypothetical protein
MDTKGETSLASMQAQPPHWHTTKEFSMLPYLEGAFHLTPLLYKMCTLKKVNQIKLYSMCLEDHFRRENISIFILSHVFFFSLKKKETDCNKKAHSLYHESVIMHATLPPHAFSPPMDEHQE